MLRRRREKKWGFISKKTIFSGLKHAETGFFGRLWRHNPLFPVTPTLFPEIPDFPYFPGIALISRGSWGVPPPRGGVSVDLLRASVSKNFREISRMYGRHSGFFRPSWAAISVNSPLAPSLPRMVPARGCRRCPRGRPCSPPP